ncbi:MAG: hypothetical protein GY795_42315 [Desulfobacterales bacterium]|nr:hypothetical protein [Desulfobacterales bacterium]
MTEIQNKIIDAMEKSSARGKTMLHPTDLAKKVGFRAREIKKDMRYLIDNGELAYYHLGCTTCIMLKKDYDLQSKREMLTVSNA